MAGRIALAAVLLTGMVAVAGAAPAPLLVLDAPGEASGLRATLAGVADRNGTALVDLSASREPAPRAAQLLARAVDAYQALEHQAALAQIDAGLAEAAQTGALGLSTTDLSDLLLYRALVMTEQGNAAAAWDDFLRAAVVDPTRKLDPVRFPPRVAETFQRATDAVQAARKVAVSVTAPEGCAVRIDGREGNAGAAVSVPAGEHFVRVECAGARPFGARVLVAGPEHVVQPSLEAPQRTTVADAAALAHRRGAAWALLALVTASPEAPPTLQLQLVEAATGKPGDSALVALDGDVAAAAQRLIDRIVAPGPPIVVAGPVGPTPWYRKPWVWGLAGAAVATAVLLPFVLDSGPASGFDTELVFP